MNFMETDYEKTARRVKRIRENPDPTKLKATAMLYEQQMELRAHQLEVWKSGRPFCTGLGNLSPLVHSLGFESLNLPSEADKVTDGERYFNVLRQFSYPDHHCDRTIVGVGLVLAGDLPVPAMSVSTNFACDPEMLMDHVLGHHYPSIQHFCLDVDSVHDRATEKLLAHMKDQLGEWIEFAESRVPGIKYNEDRMVELIEYDRRALSYLLEVYELRKRKPCPISGQDVFRIPRRPSQFPYPEKVVEYYRVMRDEMAEKAEKGEGAVKEEKVRIMWTITAPYFSDVFKILEEKGASVVHFQIGAAARLFGARGGYSDEKEYGRKLSPLEEQARQLTLNSWSGLSNRWVDNMIYFCKDLDVDGIVHFEQWGCVAAVLARAVVKDRIEQELGIPNLFVEGRNMDTSSMDLADFRERLVQFVDICVDRKAQREAGKN